MCGIAIEKKNEGSVQLQKHEATVYVDVACGVCWISNGTHRRWQGIREAMDNRGNVMEGSLIVHFMKCPEFVHCI